MIIPLRPRTEEIHKLMERLIKLDNPKYPKSVRITPNIAESLSKYKTIRQLYDMDLCDIARKTRGKRRSILYIPPHVKITKKEGRYWFDFR